MIRFLFFLFGGAEKKKNFWFFGGFRNYGNFVMANSRKMGDTSRWRESRYEPDLICVAILNENMKRKKKGKKAFIIMEIYQLSFTIRYKLV